MNPRRTASSGLLLALLALITQIALGAVVPQLARATEVAGVICHVGAASSEQPAPAKQHPLDCLLCPVCLSLTTAASLLPTTGGPFPLPKVTAYQPPGLPPSTAPPLLRLAAAQPRGPPSLI
jgi:hypothetical protein